MLAFRSLVGYCMAATIASVWWRYSIISRYKFFTQRDEVWWVNRFVWQHLGYTRPIHHHKLNVRMPLNVRVSNLTLHMCESSVLSYIHTCEWQATTAHSTIIQSNAWFDQSSSALLRDRLHIQSHIFTYTSLI